MPIQIHDLKFILSGGATNGTPSLSLGGKMSQLNGAVVQSQIAKQPTFVTGVTIDNAYGNPVGNGTLRWDAIASRIEWKPLGGVQFNGADVTASGTYTIGDASGYLVVTIDVPNLPTSTVSDTDITISYAVNNVFDSVSSQESTDGRIEYRCLYIKNTHATDTAYDVRLWIASQPIGPDQLAIALDPAGIGNGDTTGVAIGPLADEVDSGGLLSGINWAQPSSRDTALQIGNLAPGESMAFWEKRTVPPDTVQQVTDDTSRLALSALI